MSTQHTPGPWRVIQSGFGTTVWAGEENSPHIIADNGNHLPATVANAHLIAAAPDMLEALRPFAEWARQYELGTAGEMRDEALWQSLRRAVHAVTKATGAQS